MPRRFTLREAESLLPEIEKSIRDAVSLKSQMDEVQSKLQSITQRVIMMGGILVDREAIYAQRLLHDRNAERLKTTLESVQESGCIVKDLDIGLIDFPTLFRDREVYLCWKMGEPGIHFWHGVDEGFAGRKPIDQDFLDHHQGDPAN
ncbi:MAG: hypothetical protein DMG57_23010 [Acidobacteria bacterium]|nr:MAG: hypothetical protein DMG57_23010 [Acidobacteriota bacterium]